MTDTKNPGIAARTRPRRSRRLTASLIGATLGLVYILVKASALPSPGAPVLRGAGIVVFVLFIARPRAASNDEAPRDHSPEVGFGRS